MHVASRWWMIGLLLVSWPGHVLAEDAGTKRWNEVTHRVEARISGEVVDLTVLRTFHNPSRHFLEQEERFELPWGSTVNGFAFEAQGRWTDGLLLDSTQARDRYKALRHKGPAAPVPVAWLSDWDGWMRLRMWNVPPRGSVTVRYTLRARLGYSEGRSTFSYPLSINEDAPRPLLTVVPPHPGFVPRIDPGKEEIGVSWVAERPTRVEARASQVALGSGALGLIQVRAPPRLSPRPVSARVVFVVDASHSVGPEGITQQLAIAGAYLRQLPDATAEVVVFRRAAERLFGRFVSASDWKDTLAAVAPARLAPGNGSHLDEGLRLAQQVLTDGRGPARILALTDGRLRQAYAPVPPAPVTSASDAAVHLLLRSNPDARTLPFERLVASPVQDACGQWLFLPEVGLPSSKALESLVRPVRWDTLRFEDTQGERKQHVPTLFEGHGYDIWMWLPETTPLPLTLRGEAWRCPVSVQVEVDPALFADLRRHAYAENPSAFSLGIDEERSSEVRRRLAAAGDWMSEEHSFLAVPPGAGPASARTHALDDSMEEGGAISVGSTGCGCVEEPAPDQAPTPDESSRGLDAELERLLRAAITACPRGSKPLQVQVETTGDELVDVRVMDAASAQEEACVREAAWTLRLGASFKGDTAPFRRVTLRP